jgi:hypothetical protein
LTHQFSGHQSYWWKNNKDMNIPSWFQLPLCCVIFFLEHICGEIS